jgi:hypothetical protein
MTAGITFATPWYLCFISCKSMRSLLASMAPLLKQVADSGVGGAKERAS